MKILYIAPVDNYTAVDGGYGNGSASILHVLNNMLEEGRIGGLTVFNTQKPMNVNKDDLDNDVGILVTNPSSFTHEQTLKQLLYCMSGCKRKYLVVLWETMPLPKFWNILWESTYFDGFLAPSYFIGVQMAQVSKKAVYYQPYYKSVNKNDFIDINSKKDEEIFTCLFVGQNTKRKGINETISSFSRAFDQIKDAQLIMKYHNLSSYENNLENLIKELALTNQCCKNAKIFTLEKNLTNNELKNLYRSSSVLLTPSRGEGFGICVQEAMALGLPVIYSNWSSMPEVGESEWNYPIDCHIDEAVNMYQYGYEIGLKYAYPNIGHLISTLRKAYVLWKKDKIKYYTNSLNNTKIIKDKFNYQIVSDCIEHAIHGKEGFCPDYIFNSKHWDRNLEQYNKIVKGEM